MYKLKLIIWLTISSLCLIFPLKGNVEAQAVKSNSGDVTCPATGTSIQILAQNSGRYSFLLNNINGQPVRIGYVNGASTAALTSSNAWILQPGQAIGDSIPNVNSSRIVCMSTTAISNVITFYEGYR